MKTRFLFLKLLTEGQASVNSVLRIVEILSEFLNVEMKLPSRNSLLSWFSNNLEHINELVTSAELLGKTWQHNNLCFSEDGTTINDTSIVTSALTRLSPSNKNENPTLEHLYLASKRVPDKCAPTIANNSLLWCEKNYSKLCNDTFDKSQTSIQSKISSLHVDGGEIPAMVNCQRVIKDSKFLIRPLLIY